jgi:hypothetical protein
MGQMEYSRNFTKRIAWALIAVWLSIDSAVVLEVAAQARRTRRQRVVMPQQRQETVNTDITTDLKSNILAIAQRVSSQSQNSMVDLVFVIDSSRDMMDGISVIQKSLIDMANVFEEDLIDYQFAHVSFQKVAGTSRTTIQSFENDLVASQAWFRELQMSRSAETGDGLDAILQTIRETNFRLEARKHILVLTNSRLQTAWTAEKAKDKIVKEIVNLCKQDNIHVNIIGKSERAQIQLTAKTGGKFYAISGGGQKGVKFVDLGDLDKSILKIEGVFRLTAQHIAATVKQPADVVFMFDSSLSMAAKSNKIKTDKICAGIDEMASILNSTGINYRFGVIRFWSAIGSGDSVVVLSKPPLNTEQVKRLYRAPKQGDKHLLGAVIKGVPKIKTPVDRQLVLVIVTDGSAGHRAAKGYTVNQAIGVCRKAGAQVNVIGESSMNVHSYKGRFGGRAVSPSVEFQKRVAETTNGVHYVMPETSD